MKRIFMLLVMALTFVMTPTTINAERPVLTGKMTVEATSELIHGGHIDITMSVIGKLTPGSAVYTTVVLKQGSQIVYASSAFAPYAEFELVQQIGFESIGIFIDPTKPAEGSAALMYRQPNGKGYKYTFLDQTTFSIP